MIGHVLTYTCDIIRKTATGTDALGSPTYSEATAVNDTPCRPLERKRSAYSDAQARFVQQTVFALLLPASVDVREDDIVTNLTDPEGTTDTRRYMVKDKVTRRGRNGLGHHVTVELETIGP